MGHNSTVRFSKRHCIFKSSKTKMADLTQNPRWVARVLGYFDHADMDKNGILQIDEVVAMFADTLVNLCHPTEVEMATYKKNLLEFYTNLGVTKEGIKRADWPAAVNRFSMAERERISKGQPTIHSKVSDAFFNIIDQNKGWCH